MIAIDLPGFGESELPHEDISIPGYGRFVDAFLGEIGVERAALVGNSMGGFIAAETAISHPQPRRAAGAGVGRRAACRWRHRQLDALRARRPPASTR